MRHFILVACLLVGCAATLPKAEEIKDTHDCNGACKHLQDLKCSEGNDYQGQSCVEFCTQTQDTGHALKPSCVLNITKCEDMFNLDKFCPKS